MSQSEKPSIPEQAVIKSMDELVARIIAWHSLGIAQANHMLEMPEGFESNYTGEDGVEVKIDLSGDRLKAFRMGILTAIDAFRELPIAYVAEDKEVANDKPTTSPEQ